MCSFSQGSTDAVARIRSHFSLKPTDSAAFLYDHMASQSGEQIEGIYVPFDAAQRGHFVGRGQILDYVTSTTGGGGRVLDFGPGDGWPSLLMSPRVDQVVGVDGSRRRVDVCIANTERMGITNAEFIHVPPGDVLPFADNTFDGATAASSVEQTPDPKATLAELYRVLKPGGAVRLHYESLGYYRGGRERDVGLSWDGPLAWMVVFDRRPDEEIVHHYGLQFDISGDEVKSLLARCGAKVAYDALTSQVLGELQPHVTGAATWTTHHPSCRTLLAWLAEVGFSEVRATHDGGRFAGALFDRMDVSRRPKDMGAVDALLAPLVEVVVEMAAPTDSPPGEWDAWVKALK